MNKIKTNQQNENHKNRFALLLAVIFLVSGVLSKAQIVGQYMMRSNGVSEKLELKEDSTFVYSILWQHFYRKSQGKYSVIGSKLILNSDERYTDFVDEFRYESYNDTDSVGNQKLVIFTVGSEEDQLIENYHTRLFAYDESGTLISRQMSCGAALIPEHTSLLITRDIKYHIQDSSSNRIVMRYPDMRIFENEEWVIIDENTIQPRKLYLGDLTDYCLTRCDDPEIFSLPY